jgi:hypothetical protein
MSPIEIREISWFKGDILILQFEFFISMEHLRRKVL